MPIPVMIAGWFGKKALSGAARSIAGFVLRHWKPIALAVGVVAVAWISRNHGYDTCAAEHAAAAEAAEDRAAAQTVQLTEDFAGIDLAALTTLQAIEKTRTIHHDRIRTVAVEIYRDRPGCALPEQLWRASDRHTAELAAAAGIEPGAVRPAAAARDGRDPGADGP